MTMKLCAGCGIRKEASEFYEEPSKKNADGLAPYCKQCFADYGLRHERRCKKCGETKPLTREFWVVNSACKNGFDHLCRKCDVKRGLNYYHTHKEQRSAYASNAYIQKREHILAKNKAWRLANPEKENERHVRWSKNNPEKRKQIGKSYRQRNPEKIRARDNNKRAKRRNAHGKHTPQDVQRIYVEQCGLCAYCGIELNGIYDVDHIMPLSRGGSNNPENLCCACPSCNRSKNNKTPDEWKKIRGW